MRLGKMAIITFLIMLCTRIGYTQYVIQIEETAGAGADLTAALAFANSGAISDVVVELATSGGTYYLYQSDSVNVPLTIRAAEGLAEKPVIKAADGDTLVVFLRVRHHFILQGIILDGQHDDGTYVPMASFIYLENLESGFKPDFTVNDCVFRNVYEGDPETTIGGSPIQTRNGTYAGVLSIENSTFMNYADEAVLLQQVTKTPDSVDSVAIRNCTFYNTTSSNKNQGQFTVKSDNLAETPDPKIFLENLTFYNCGTSFAIRDCPGTTVRNIIIANVNDASAGGNLGSIGSAGSVISHVDTFMVSGGSFSLDDAKTPGAELAVMDSATFYNYDPMFADVENGDFTVKNPALYNKAHDGGLLGDRRWADPNISAIIKEKTISSTPTAFALSQNYPNPFNPVTTIRYSLEKTSDISINVYNLNGKLVETLYTGNKPAGEYSITWNASNLASGVYFYKLVSGSNIVTKKMMLIK